VRYFVVEGLTAVLFVAVWARFGFPLAGVYWIFIGLLVAATFIDFEHLIIPDEITLGGTVVGVLLSVGLPEMMGAGSRLEAGMESLAGAVVGFGILFFVVEAGKLVFGRIRHTFVVPEEFEWTRDGERVRFGREELAWGEIFSRKRDVMRVELDGVARADGRELGEGVLKFYRDRVEAGGEVLRLADFERIGGKMRAVVIPREAMGFGDVKFEACIGAFLGGAAVIFSIFAASVVGSVTGLAGIALARDRSGVRIPFGPFLALGALLWLFGGRELADWYLSNLRGVPPR
jgi:leader peptidase (prepilin peptidase)/N-methyltransferase